MKFIFDEKITKMFFYSRLKKQSLDIHTCVTGTHIYKKHTIYE